jgi:hypothetical protein
LLAEVINVLQKKLPAAAVIQFENRGSRRHQCWLRVPTISNKAETDVQQALQPVALFGHTGGPTD